jgi:DNA sulfur modification protein DndD
MIIEKVTINNFKNYEGPESVDLSVNSKKNIVLLGGTNGSGKTTFVESIRLCLYGQSFNGQRLSDKDYQTYLRSVFNKNSKTKSFSISMALDIGLEDFPRHIEIKRTFKDTGGKFIEDFEILRGNSSVDHISSEYWEYYVENLIHPKMSQYFFFDGENVRKIISSDESKYFLSEAVNSASGITELENLAKDLEEVRRRIVSRSSSKTSKERIKNLEEEIKKYEAFIQETSEKLDWLNSVKKEYLEKREGYDKNLNRLLGYREEQAKKLDDERKSLREKLSALNSQYLEFCMKYVPFMITYNLMKKTLDQAESESKKIIYTNAKAVISEIRNEIYSKRPDDKKEIDSVIKDIISTINEKSDADVRHIVNLSPQQTAILEQRMKDCPTSDVFIETMQKREDVIHKISQLDDALSKLDDDKISKTLSCIEELDKKIELNSHDYELAKKELSEYHEKIHNLKQMVKNEEKKTLLSGLNKQMVNDIQTVTDRIRNEIVTLRKDSIEKLTNEVNQIYSVLKNKKDMVHSISISDDCEIKMNNSDGQNISINLLSEGEKTILMYSVIYGLHRMSSTDLPVIIDSPLGRLDSTHASNLVKSFYPILGKQVIILAHDRELSSKDLDALEKNISKKYTITNNEEKKLIEGFF